LISLISQLTKLGIALCDTKSLERIQVKSSKSSICFQKTLETLQLLILSKYSNLDLISLNDSHKILYTLLSLETLKPLLIIQYIQYFDPSLINLTFFEVNFNPLFFKDFSKILIRSISVIHNFLHKSCISTLSASKELSLYKSIISIFVE
jgi:hypothetical protein